MTMDVREVHHADGATEMVLHGAHGEQLIRFSTMDQMLDVIDVLIGTVESVNQANTVGDRLVSH